MSVLVINRSDSYHKKCGPTLGNARPEDVYCSNCGEIYTIVTSDYLGGGIEDWIRRHRPDLEHHFPFEGFWKQREAVGPWVPTMAATAAWRTFPSEYEWALLDQWLQGLIGSNRDYEARLALNVVAQRKWLADEMHRFEPPAVGGASRR